MNRTAVLDRLETAGDIPTLRPTALRLLSFGEDSAADFGTLAQLVEQDPALAAHVLRVVNTPYYGVPGAVAELGRAVALLGMDKVRDLALTVVLMADATPRRGGSQGSWQEFWAHACGTALTVTALARALGLQAAGIGYATGLLHDVGKLLLAEYFPEPLGAARALAEREGLHAHEAEARVLGTDHAEVGGWLARRWGFPAELEAAIRWHHAPRRGAAQAPLAALVQVADALALSKGLGFGSAPLPVCVREQAGWRLLTHQSPRASSLDLERLTFALDREATAARDLVSAGGLA